MKKVWSIDSFKSRNASASKNYNKKQTQQTKTQSNVTNKQTNQPHDDKLRVMKICQRWVYNVLEVTNWIAQPIMSKQDDCAKLRFKVWHGLRMKENICADVSHNFPTMNNTWGLHLVKWVNKSFPQKKPWNRHFGRHDTWKTYWRAGWQLAST